MPIWLSKLLNHKYFLLFFLWSVLTVINIDKAFHIDDTFHLEAADYIRHNPDKPMSGLINWRDDPLPMYIENQPPLFFYLIALVSCIAGYNEISLHLFLSIFTFFGLYFFFQLTKILSVKKPAVLLALFAFCPAFIINQNLMLDVPVLTIILGSALFLLKAGSFKKALNYSLAASALTIGLLIKYSILPLFVVIILVIIIRRDYKNLLVLIIPAIAFSIWSLWNIHEFGFIHIFSKSAGIIHIKQLWSFIGCLGSISIFSISLVLGLFQKKIINRLIYFIIALFLIAMTMFVFEQIPEHQFSKSLNYAFMANGFMIIIALVIRLFYSLKDTGLKSFLHTDEFVIVMYLSSISAFIILFAPFMATRHVLLALPFILLFGHEFISNATAGTNRLSLTLTIVLGLLLGISDWKYADYYRRMVTTPELPKGHTVWTSGHWGWQWYSKKIGMKQYNMRKSIVKNGDYLIYPAGISQQKTNKNLKLTVLNKKWERADILTFFSVNDFASLYNSTMDKPAWRLSKSPIDTIIISRIETTNQDLFHP